MMIRSVRIREFGGPDVLRIETVDLAHPQSGEVRLRIKAIGLNRTEITLRSGRSPVRPTLPTGIGFEAAGTVEAVGPDVDNVRPGDRVALVPAYGAGQYALYGEAANVPARSLVPIHRDVDFVDAAATWAAFGTAWSGLVAVGDLRSGETVIISAASSGVGLASIQTAKRLGAKVIALTRTSAKAATLEAHGADAVIATTESDLVEEVQKLTDRRGADLVFDPVGGPGFGSLARATASGGRLILYGALDGGDIAVPPFEIFARDLTVRGASLTAVTRNDAKLSSLKDFVSGGIRDGSLRPTVARVFPFDRIGDAHRFVEAGEHVGKTVVTL